METLRQLNLSSKKGDILIRIHTTIHLADEAVDLARFIKGIIPEAKIFGTSTASIINNGHCVQNQCIISVSVMNEGRIQSQMISYIDQENDSIIPSKMICGQIKHELIEDDTKLVLTVISGPYQEMQLFVDRCNDAFPGVPMIGGVASSIDSTESDFMKGGYVFDENGWSDHSILLAAMSGKELETFVSCATGVQVIGEEEEVTDSFRSAILSIDNEDALDAFSFGLPDMIQQNPKMGTLLPYVDADMVEVPLYLRYSPNKSLQELFPKNDPQNVQEYAIRDDVDTVVKRDILQANYCIHPGKHLRRAFIYDGKVASDNRIMFRRVESFEKNETVFAYTGLVRTLQYKDYVKWELAAYEKSNACGCTMAAGIVCVNGRNTMTSNAFTVSVMGEKPYTQEFNPYALAHTESLATENKAVLDLLMDLENGVEKCRDEKNKLKMRAFLQDCERKLLFSDHEGVPNEAALKLDIKLRGYDRVCLINVMEQAEMESVFTSHHIDLTFKNYMGKCISYARAKNYHVYVLDGWSIAIAETSYRVSLTNFVRDMEALQRELFEYSEDFIAIVPIFCVIDGCTADNMWSCYNASRVTMMNKNIQFYVCDASEESDLDEESVRERYHMINVINYAISNDKVVPYFQGIYDNKEKRINHYESLMRLVDENNKVYYPSSFLDVARSYGVFYDEMSKIMIRKVFERFHNIEGISVSINISIRDIKNPDVLNLIYDSLSREKYPSQFILEILENEDVDDYTEMVSFVDRVHELGGMVSIDDFGSGFSNLQHLLSIHSDYLKIDGSIIRSCCTSKDSENIIAMISGWKMLSGNKVCIVAEYVENEAIQEKVVSYGVDYSQGYLFSRPAPDIIHAPAGDEEGART